jgi:predicted GIY-YIG superfamily endonuclease
MYVGQSTDVYARVAQHARTRKFQAWHWIPCEPEMLLALEREYIRKLAPRWNENGALIGLRYQLEREAEAAIEAGNRPVNSPEL